MPITIVVTTVSCNFRHYWLFVTLGAGFTNGTLQVLDPITLSEVGKSFRYSRDAITHISFSHDSSYLATAVSRGGGIICPLLLHCMYIIIQISVVPIFSWQILMNVAYFKYTKCELDTLSSLIYLYLQLEGDNYTKTLPTIEPSLDMDNAHYPLHGVWSRLCACVWWDCSHSQ